MKQLLSLVFVLSYFHISAQEIDLTFGDNGVISHSKFITSIKALDKGFMAINPASVSFYDDRGAPNFSLGDNGIIEGPFLGFNQDVISDAFMIDDKLMIIGCALGASTQGYDVYTRQFDIDSGNPIEGTTYTMPDPNEEEYVIPYIGSEVNLFGYSSNIAGVTTLAHNTYNPETKTFTELEIADFDTDSNGAAIPKRIMDLPDGRILVVYTKDIVGSLYRIVDDISEVHSFNATTTFSQLENNIKSNFIQLDKSTLLAIEGYSTSGLIVFDLDSETYESFDIDFVPADYMLNSIEMYDESTILLFGQIEGQVEIYAMNNELEQIDLVNAESLVVNLVGSDNFTIRTYSVGDYIYASTYGSENSEIFRLKNGFQTDTEEQVTEFNIYPSPAENELNVAGIQLEEYDFYSIFGVDGRQVQKDLLNSSTIDISTLQSGLYYLTIKSEESENTKSFLVERN